MANGNRRTRRSEVGDDVTKNLTNSKIDGKKTVNPFNFKLNSKFKNQKQKEMFKTILDNRITIVKGTAGTGKTYIALMAALECLKNENINISKILISRPLVENTSKSLGFLKGTLEEKTSEYFTHFYDNIIKLIGREYTKSIKEHGLVSEIILNFVRGSSFGEYDEQTGQPKGHICIMDEMQNLTVHETLTFLSRLGEGSKIICLGDPDQMDIKLKAYEKNGLVDAWDRLQDLEGVGFIEFDEEDIVRDPFLKEIMKRYKN